jgi:hypothetical protein
MRAQISQKRIEESDEEFCIYAMTLEKRWQESSIRFSDREWLTVFPEGRPYLKYRLRKLEKLGKKLISEIREDLRNVYKNIKDEFAIWFNEEIVRVWKGEDLNKLDKEVSKLEWLLNPNKETIDKITEVMIERAKQFPFQNLIEIKRNFTTCPFHSDRKPSFYIKNNWGYCFGCGWHGDTIKFLMEKEGLTFREAIKYLT